MGEMSQTINVEEFDKDQKLIKYLSAVNSTLVKIYTSVIDVANEIYLAIEVKGDISELTKLFGEPIIVEFYTAREVKAWIKSRERQLNDDNNAVCMRVHENTLKKIGQYNIDSIKPKNLSSYIALVIYNKKTNKIIDSQLIFYNELDERLNSLLANGHGMFIIDP